ncbi:MAG: oxidoreductase coenzyme F420-dependent [Mycobacterium sp.]|jgi:predicted dinucleotide-binding enzyme|nr:oxidoreductase coenzyme F420-dependent [Mycobacterium sp.]
MKIGFIGAGAIAQAIGAQLARAGHRVILSNSRGPATLADVVRAPNLAAGTPDEAGAQEAVFLAVNWSKIPAALGAAGDLSGRVLIDTTNPLEAPDFVKADLGGRTSSEVVGAQAAGAHLVKAFNHMTPASYLSGPRRGGAPKLLFHSSDHDDAHDIAAALITDLGYMPIDLGPLAIGGALHEFPGGVFASRTFVELTPNE